MNFFQEKNFSLLFNWLKTSTTTNNYFHHQETRILSIFQEDEKEETANESMLDLDPDLNQFKYIWIQIKHKKSLANINLNPPDLISYYHQFMVLELHSWF